MTIDKKVNPRFEDFIFNWDYKTYLLVGGYGSSKSYNTALKLVLKCLSEVRKVLVVREVYESLRESCYDLLREIIYDLGLTRKQVIIYKNPIQIDFCNGSKIIFKGMDKPEKLKSINDVSIVWLEEASEVKYEGYKELLGRLRHPTKSLHIFLTLNPVGIENWVYRHFFKRLDEQGQEVVILDDNDLYEQHTIVHNGVYYHHSLCTDNLFLPQSYMDELESMKDYDPDLYRVAKLGRFGVNGRRVLPQFTVDTDITHILSTVNHIPSQFHFCGMDFGFEESYNAVIQCAVDDKEKVLYIYNEYYKNHMTDDKTAKDLKALGLDKVLITADCAEPKAIQYYNQEGFRMRPCTKYTRSRLENTRKVKRFKKIICSGECINTIRELQTLTYAKDKKGNMIDDEFNIDPHTFSAIWYALDNYTVADIKNKTRHHQSGDIGG
jgi:phage terminase large subunit